MKGKKMSDIKKEYLLQTIKDQTITNDKKELFNNSYTIKSFQVKIVKKPRISDELTEQNNKCYKIVISDKYNDDYIIYLHLPQIQ